MRLPIPLGEVVFPLHQFSSFGPPSVSLLSISPVPLEGPIRGNPGGFSITLRQ